MEERKKQAGVADGALDLDTVRQDHADLLILDIMMRGPNDLNDLPRPVRSLCPA